MLLLMYLMYLTVATLILLAIFKPVMKAAQKPTEIVSTVENLRITAATIDQLEKSDADQSNQS